MMEVNIRDIPGENEQQPPRNYRALIIRLIIFLYVMTYLTSDKKGLPSPADVLAFTLHILSRMGELLSMIVHLFDTVDTNVR